MTIVSPLLKSRLTSTPQMQNSNMVSAPQMSNMAATLQQNRANKDKIYEDLTQHANDVKPNIARAKLVKDNPMQAVIHSVQDTGADIANFFKAVKDGKVGDNSLGRINDVGMKFGAGIIATFLALNSKTTTEKIMKFVGGATFIAVMDLWPKLFINLPARLVHGFDIGQKYISAQGEKKDFFIDNQFLPWDAYSKEELTEIGKRTGIDINSENGEEKIKRKMQKVALQNRTLWMLTAGFATPLLTSVVAGKLENYVQNGIIKHNYNKAMKQIEKAGSVDNLLANSKASSIDLQKSEMRLNSLFKNHQTGELDESFFKKLSKELSLDTLLKGFSNPDDARIQQDFKSVNLTPSLQQLYKDKATVDAKALAEKLKQAELILNSSAGISSENLTFDELGNVVKSEAKTTATLNEAQIKEIISQLGEKPTIQQVENALFNQGCMKGKTQQLIASLSKDNTPFFNAVKEFNSTVVQNTKAQVKTLINLINPLIGEKSESVYTKEYLDTVSNLFKKAGFSENDLRLFASETPNAELSKMIQGYFAKLAQGNDYLTKADQLYKETDSKLISQIEAIAKSASQTLGANPSGEFKELTEALMGQTDSSVHIGEIIENFIKTRNADIQTFKAKPIIATLFERRLIGGEQSEFYKSCLEKGIINPQYKESYEAIVRSARNAIYNSSSGNTYNNYCLDKSIANEFKEVVFDTSKYTQALASDSKMAGNETLKSGIETALEAMKLASPDKKTYVSASSFVEQLKTQTRALCNNKSWKKMFVPATIALIALTLLAQPFFGNISKEYKDKNGGNK